MNKLDALWRRDYADFALREIAKEILTTAPKSPLDAMIDAACMKPTAFGKKLERERNKAIERNLREIIKCQEVLGEDATVYREYLDKLLGL